MGDEWMDVFGKDGGRFLKSNANAKGPAIVTARSRSVATKRKIRIVRGPALKITKIDCHPCPHSDVLFSRGERICKTCGIHLESHIVFEPEWHSYCEGPDTSRCHLGGPQTKAEASPLKAFFDSLLCPASAMILDASTKMETEVKYAEVTGGDTFQGKRRDALAATCLLYSFRERGDMRTSEEVRAMTSLTKKDMSFGLCTYNSHIRAAVIKGDMPPTGGGNPAIRPRDLLRRTMVKADIPLCRWESVISFSNRVEDACIALRENPISLREESSILRADARRDGSSGGLASQKGMATDDVLGRSSPQAVAAAIVFSYAADSGAKIKKVSFAARVGVSDVTLGKLCKRIVSLIAKEE